MREALWLILCAIIEISLGIFLGRTINFYLSVIIILLVGVAFGFILHHQIKIDKGRIKLIKRSKQDSALFMHSHDVNKW